MKRQVYSFTLLFAIFLLTLVPNLEAQGIPTPEQFYGFQMGADGKLAHWNTIAEVPREEFYCPGSTLNISVDTAHPLGYGMALNAYAVFRRSPSLRVSAGSFQDKITVAARYHEETILQSGRLIGEQYLSNKPAVLEFKIEKGKVIVLAFPAQHRAQTHGTFKFLFNAIYYGSAVDGTY